MTALPEFVLLPEEAKRRGFRSPLAFRRWCERNGVAVRIDGKKRWIRPLDVDEAVRGKPLRGLAASAAAAVDQWIGGRRG